MSHWAVRSAGLAAVCVLTGGAALLTGEPNGMGLIVWPPVGFGLIALLAGGWRLAPAYWVGVFLPAWSMAAAADPDLPPASIAAAAAIGATVYTAQAALGAALIRWWVGYPTPLVRGRDVAVFLFVAGPLHTLPGAFACAGIGAALGAFPRANGFAEFRDWWWADAVGGVVFAPIALALVGRPRETWRPRRLTVALPLAVAAAAVAAAFWWVRLSDRTRGTEQVRAEAGHAAAVLQADLDRLMAGLNTLRHDFHLAAQVRDPAARPFVLADLRMLRRTTGLLRDAKVALFVPRDRLGQIADELDGWGAPGVVGFDPGEAVAERPEYLVVVAAEPPGGGRSALGLDLFSDPLRADAVARAVGANVPTATAPSDFAPSQGGGRDTIVVYLPFGTDTGSGIEPPVGVVGAGLDRGRVRDVLGVGRDPRLRFALYDPAVENPPHIGPDEFAVPSVIRVADRELVLSTAAPDDFMAERHDNRAGLVAAAGFGLAGLLAALMLNVTGRTAVVAEEVEARTKALREEVAVRQFAEASLRASQARLAEAQRIAKLGYWEFDPGTGRLAWSAEMYRLFGVNEGEFSPTVERFHALVHPDDRSAVAAAAANAIRGETHTQLQFRAVRPDGATRYMYKEVRVERDAAGRPVRVTGVTQDVTERVEAETEKLKFEAKLRETQKLESLGVLAGGVAHDFNNLLTGVLGNASLARELLPADSELHEYLRPIERSAEHAAQLCQQMLTYAGRGESIRGLVDLNRLTRESADLLRVSVPKAAALRYELGADVPPLIADPGQLRQILLNLVHNAAEALDAAGGTVTVATGTGAGPPAAPAGAVWSGDAPAGPHVWLEVADTGRGMDPDTLGRVFEPFFTTKFTGRGLGLSAVHGIVRSHGGAILVASGIGRGTRFRVYLPVEPAAEPETDCAEPAAGRVALLADADPTARAAAALALKSQGLAVEEAANPRDAAARVRRDPERYAVVVLAPPDGADARDILAVVREFAPEMPAVLVGSSDSGESGYDERVQYLAKPFGPADLTACLRRLLGRPPRLTPWERENTLTELAGR